MSIDQRDALLETGLALIHRRGFGATGVREIAQAAGVPQGSFTNHFRSKDAFGLLILERYADKLDTIMDVTLDDGAIDPRDRLRGYFDHIEALLAEGAWQQGCLIVDLTAEMPMHSDTIRQRLVELLQHQSGRIEQVCGLIGTGADATDLAGFILAAWHGTLLRMKTERDSAAIARFRRMLDQLLRT